MEGHHFVSLSYCLLLFTQIEGEQYLYTSALLNIVLGLSWLKVFSHNTAGGMFPNGENHPDRLEVLNFNDDDPDAYLYSILDQMEEYRKEGVFHIKLCYPEYPEDFPCNEWSQSSNFVDETDVTDYSPIQISYLEAGWGNTDFAGLKKMVGWYRGYFLISPYSWYFGIGYGYSGGTTFEGAGGKPWVSKLEVYLLAGKTIVEEKNY